MASASIRAMTPMTMMGKKRSGSRDRICAATASASGNRQGGGGGGGRAESRRAADLNKIKLEIELFGPPPLKAENVLAQRKSP